MVNTSGMGGGYPDNPERDGPSSLKGVPIRSSKKKDLGREIEGTIQRGGRGTGGKLGTNTTNEERTLDG